MRLFSQCDRYEPILGDNVDCDRGGVGGDGAASVSAEPVGDVCGVGDLSADLCGGGGVYRVGFLLSGGEAGKSGEDARGADV